jgi:hypothetical protein
VDADAGAGGREDPVVWLPVRIDHNFQRFLKIFGKKLAFILKNQCYDRMFA